MPLYGTQCRYLETYCAAIMEYNIIYERVKPRGEANNPEIHICFSIALSSISPSFVESFLIYVEVHKFYKYLLKL